MTNSTTGPAGNSSDTKGATELWTYVKNRFPRFTINQALDVIHELAPTGLDDPKVFAKRLRAGLLRRGIAIKHTNAIDAAAWVLGGVPWHQARRNAPAGGLNVYLLPDFRHQVFTAWSEARSTLVEACAGWCATHPSTKVLRLVFASTSIAVVAVRSAKSGAAEVGQEETVVIINANGESLDWMAGAGPVFESVRRRLEETQTAVLDGYALLQFCSNAASEDFIGGSGARVSTSDVVTSELILLRDDFDVGPEGAYEIARGDEEYCWLQLDLALEGKVQVADSVDGAWHAGDARFVWKVATIHPKGYVPGLTVSERIDFGKSLFHRYKLAQRILGNTWPSRPGAKRIADLDGPADTCRVNLHRLLLAMNKAGLDWSSYCAEAGEEFDPKPELPMGFVMGLIDRLRPQEPNQLFGRPPRAELMRATDDHLLRTLMPRAQRAIYRLPEATIQAEQREAVIEAVNDFSASLAMRSGMFPISEPLPDLVYSTDCEQLRLTLEELGFVMYFGLVPYLHTIPQEALEKTPEVFPYAFGRALYLDIDHAG